MSKHLQNLDRLCQKLEQRFGDGDDLVQALKLEISAKKEKKAKELAAKNLGRRSVDTPGSAATIH